MCSSGACGSVTLDEQGGKSFQHKIYNGFSEGDLDSMVTNLVQKSAMI